MESPLNEVHSELGAKFFEFAGWRLPMRFESTIKEVLAVRNHAGVFDVSHMGRFVLEGGDALKLLQRATTNDMGIDVGRTRYTLTLNHKGGIKDDNVAMRVSENKFVFVVNAANRGKILNWLTTLNEGWGLDVTIRDVTLDTAMIAVQGPKAREIVHKMLGRELKIRKFRVTSTEYEGREVLVSRTGYTGEDGYELIFNDHDLARRFLRLVVESGVTPCGLVARDVLRLEAGLVLYGNDIDEGTNPYEARLDFAVKLDKAEFVGRESLVEIVKRGVNRLRVGLLSSDRSAPRKGDIIIHEGRQVGIVTSGTFSPTIGRGIAMGYVERGLSEEGTELLTRGVKEIRVVVHKMPFYDEEKYGWRRKKLT